MSTFAGVNLPWIGCETITNNNIERCNQTIFKGTWNYASMDVLHNVVKDRNTGLVVALRQMLKADCHAIWDAKDPIPAFVSGLRDARQAVLHPKKLI